MNSEIAEYCVSTFSEWSFIRPLLRRAGGLGAPDEDPGGGRTAPGLGTTSARRQSRERTSLRGILRTDREDHKQTQAIASENHRSSRHAIEATSDSMGELRQMPLHMVLALDVVMVTMVIQ
jgi:hypothetical protein